MKTFTEFTSIHSSGQRFLSDPSPENLNCLALSHVIKSVSNYYGEVSHLLAALEAAGIVSDSLEWSPVEELLQGLIDITDEKGFKPVFAIRKQELSEMLSTITDWVHLLEMQLLYSRLKDIELD